AGTTTSPKSWRGRSSEATMNFDRSEFDHRYGRLRAALETAGLDALLVTHEANFNYFTGFVVQQPWVSYSRNLVAILPRDDPPALLVSRSLADEARRETWIERVESHDALGEAPVELIARVCRDLGLTRARLGAELGYEQRLNLSYRDVERLEAALPDATLVDASPTIWQVRMVKSDADIACLRRACAITAAPF